MSINNKVYRNEFQIKLNQKNQVTQESFCKTCDAGPWREDATGSDGKSILGLHRKLKHEVVEYSERKLKGKANWGNTEIEKVFTDYMIANYDEMLHKVITSSKPAKACLIKDKWKWVNPK